VNGAVSRGKQAMPRYWRHWDWEVGRQRLMNINQKSSSLLSRAVMGRAVIGGFIVSTAPFAHWLLYIRHAR